MDRKKLQNVEGYTDVNCLTLKTQRTDRLKEHLCVSFLLAPLLQRHNINQDHLVRLSRAATVSVHIGAPATPLEAGTRREGAWRSPARLSRRPVPSRPRLRLRRAYPPASNAPAGGKGDSDRPPGGVRPWPASWARCQPSAREGRPAGSRASGWKCESCGSSSRLEEVVVSVLEVLSKRV